jgi:hypothetical protein
MNSLSGRINGITYKFLGKLTPWKRGIALQILRDIKRLPDRVKMDIEEIQFVDNLPSSKGAAYIIPPTSFEGAVLVFDVSQISPTGTRKMVYHEIGHMYTRAADFDLNTWKQIWKTEKVSDYAKKDYDEGFAEALAMYFDGPSAREELRKYYPKTYNFIKEWLRIE